MANSTPPGYYHAAGDPLDTMRYWDGDRWVGEPTVMASQAAAGGRDLDNARFAPLGVRIKATLLDGLVAIGLALPIVIVIVSYYEDEGDQQTLINIYAGLMISAVFFVSLAKFGGTPGKLMAGLVVTRNDGSTYPIGWGLAFRRTIPNLVTSIPIFGLVIALGIIVASVSMMSNDPQRRSVFDRVADTRVVFKERLG